MNLPSRPIAYLCLGLSMSLVGSYVALSKPLAAVFPVMLLAWLRFGIGAVAMLGWLKRPAGEAPLSRQTKLLLFLESFLGNFLFTLCMISGVAMTSAVTAGVTMAAIPAAIAIMSWLFLREAVARRTWIAIALAVAGISLNAVSTESAAASSEAAQHSLLGQ
ncbi:MAG: DMT family transporter, partial [Comamonas sp.]|nr:DMT family transporter [Comamonas sp.]